MRSYPGLSSEAMLYAARGNKEKGPDIVRNILIGQAVNSVGNAVLDFFEPAQRKKEEEKDFGDRTRDAARGLLNLGTGVNQALLLARGLGVMDNQPKGAAQGETQNFNERTPASPPPRPGASETAPSQTEGYAPFGKMPNEPALTERTRQGEATELTANLMQGSSPYGLLKGGELTSAERTRQGEELVKAARAERMPGLVVTDLTSMVDEDRLNRIRGIRPKLDKELTQKRLTDEMMGYPSRSVEALMQRIEEPSDYAKGVAAGMEAMTMRKLQSQAPSQTIDVTFTDEERRSTPYTAPETSSNPLLKNEPMGFNETFGVKGGVPMARAARKEEDEESLANFYANLPADPSTGERQLNFATKYLADKGSIDPVTVMAVDPEVDIPRNSGGLLQGQLRGETLYNQQENREPFVQDQQMDAINSIDEQGPGFKSQSIGDLFLQNAKDMAQSDARLYRKVGERIGNMRQILNEAEDVPEKKANQLLQQTLGETKVKMSGEQPAGKLSEQFRGQLGSLGESLGKLTRTVDDKLQREESSLMERQQNLQAQQAELEKDMSNFREATSTGSKSSSALVAPSRTLSAEPTVKKTTIIEETVPAAQTRMSPLEASEKLRRIQTSGRPTARQEAQDFLQSIKGQMIDG